MSERPPFDPLRAAFWLVAGVIAVQCFVVLMGVGSCLYFAREIMESKAACNAREVLADLLSQALAAAMGFAGGYMRGKDK